jgi:hypothetical protein
MPSPSRYTVDLLRPLLTQSAAIGEELIPLLSGEPTVKRDDLERLRLNVHNRIVDLICKAQGEGVSQKEMAEALGVPVELLRPWAQRL